mmetsp:Transcript_83246/g.160812  ORF Transcript_83246/g.160812 Transcript_83246/m.160812 type:complete len:88 (+) Transcript_83246:278-541(+)
MKLLLASVRACLQCHCSSGDCRLCFLTRITAGGAAPPRRHATVSSLDLDRNDAWTDIMLGVMHRLFCGHHVVLIGILLREVAGAARR